MPRLGNKQGRCAGNTGSKGNLARHNKAAGLFAAVRQALFKNKLICALTWVFCHAGFIAPKAAAGNVLCPVHRAALVDGVEGVAAGQVAETAFPLRFPLAKG